VDDKELLAAIGQVVVDSAALEFAVAILVAVTEGLRDQDCEDHAVTTVKTPGGAMRELRMRAAAQLRGKDLPVRQIARMLPMPKDDERPVRQVLARWDRLRPGFTPVVQCDLGFLWRDAKAVLDDRHILAHSIALDDAEAGLVIFNPRTGMEARLTTPAVSDHAHDIRIVYRRIYEAIAAETAVPGNT
jgi:hypothetical protein